MIVTVDPETKAAAGPRPTAGKTAVLVIHGIGEQDPYETLDQFARGLADHYRLPQADARRQPSVEPLLINHEGWNEVAVRLTLMGELRQFADFIAGFEYGPHQLTIPFVEVNRRGAVPGAKGPRMLSATVEVSGYLLAEVKSKAPEAEPAEGEGEPAGGAAEGEAAAGGGEGGTAETPPSEVPGGAGPAPPPPGPPLANPGAT